MSDHKEKLKAAKKQANIDLANMRIALLDTKIENEELGIPDDYELCLKAILSHYDKPLPLGFISEVLPDSALLLKVRKQLRKATDKSPQEIEEYKDGEDQTRTMIRLLPTAPAPSEDGGAATAETPAPAKAETPAPEKVEAPAA